MTTTNLGRKNIILIIITLLSLFVFIFGLKVIDEGNVLPFILESKKEAKILIVGDMFFDRKIRQIVESKGDDFLFSCINPLLKNADLVVGNLEGPITAYASVSVGTVVGSPENFRFTFPISTASMLAKHNIKLVGLGNNHISNFGQSGIVETKKYLTEAGVNFFGGIEETEPIYRTEINGLLFSFVSYNQFGQQTLLTANDSIKKEKESSRIVIVVAHWGEEYTDTSSGLREIAKNFSKSGASVIVGTHPHVVLPNEIIDDTIVYYSIGNFIFDQYFSEEVKNGLTILLEITGNSILVTEHPVIINRDGRTCLADS